MPNNKCTCEELQEAAEAYEELIGAGDKARLLPCEIRELAEAIGNLPAGESFTVTISTLNPAEYSKTVSVEY